MADIYFSGSKNYMAARIVLQLAVAVLITGFIDGSTPSFFGFFSPMKWPMVNETQKATWQNTVLINRAALKLESLPIGCVTRDTSGDLWVDGETYACSRQLSSISGQWGSNWMLIEFQLWPDSLRIKQLEQIPTSLLNRNLLVLDSVSHMIVDQINVEKFRTYIVAKYTDN
jgi:hypothetical protein